ncbi:MAG: GEVED domain-containing protein [Flavobacteriaceae bacterium]
MKTKNYFFLLILAVFSFTANAQEATPNVPANAIYSETITPEYVPSIASRMSELPAYVDVTKEAQDKRSLGNTVIIGKDRQTQDDYFSRNPSEASQTTRVAPPTIVFDAYQSNSTPTDPSMAVGPNHVVVVFNTGFAIYDKSGNLMFGPMAPNPTIFPNSGCCDLTVSYDNAADRWVMTFLGSGAQIAVSDGPDPINDGWNNYSIGAISDYQKLSVWSDGYYMTENTGGGNKVWALERTEMLAGNAAQVIGFPLPGMTTSGFFSPQAFNVTDDNLPAAGGATFVYLQDDAWGGVATDHVKLWTLDMDWGAGNGTMSAATELPATPFISVFDGGSFSNLAQPGGSSVDALQATVMNQAQFRKFAGHNSAVFNFVVDTDAGGGELAGVRWFELRQTDDNQPWTVYQEGTYTAPNGKHAWHASMAMDAAGNIAMGYTSMAGPTTPNPTDFRISSYYSGRFDGDPLGTMTVVEEIIAAGNANIGSTRYGDYSKIDVDPLDDSTFWFINEYMNGGRKGVVGAFSLTPPGPDDIGVTTITDPNTGTLTTTEVVSVEVRNFGSNDITNPEVQYIADGGAPIVETLVGTIVAGATTTYAFAATADLSAPGNHTIVARTNLAGDSNPNNDEATKTVFNGTLYCEPTEDCSFGDGFTNVTVQEINNNSDCEGYADFTNLTATLEPGNSYDFTVTTGYGDQNVRVWIDFDDNGTFETSETVVPNFVIAAGQAAGTYTETVTLTIPGSVATGSQHRMRVKSNWQAPVPDDACEETTYGETEDYSANMGILGVEDPSISQAEFTVLTLPNNQFDITLTTSFDGVASIAIYNVLGQTLAFNNLNKEGDSYNYHLDMSYADAGVYFIKMGDNSSKTYKTAKIIVK